MQLNSQIMKPVRLLLIAIVVLALVACAGNEEAADRSREYF